MEFDNDIFPPSLPSCSSPPQIVDLNMAEAVNTNPHDYFETQNYLYNEHLDNEFAELASHKPSPDGLPSSSSAFIPPSSGSSHNESSSDSQANTIDSSDTSSADVPLGSREGAPGRIPIPADVSDEPTVDYLSMGAVDNGEDTMMSNDLFDFDSAATSPTNPSTTNPSTTLASRSVKMPIRPAPNAAFHSFGPGSFAGGLNQHASYEGSSLSISSRHNRHSSEYQPTCVPGSVLQNTPQLPIDRPPSPSPIIQQAPPSVNPHFRPAALHIGELPRTQRVETQMHVDLTMWPLAEGVTKLHFQGYTMARTKLAIKPSPPKSPSMLEVYAHCVCATAMEDPEKLQQALGRAAEATRDVDANQQEPHAPPRSLNMAEDDPRKPMNGGFVFICDQCIRRENKRIARKKLKNEDEEESWLGDQPKRIIVFNKAEILDWQSWQSTKGEDENPEGTPTKYPSSQQFPEGAMRVRVPMRIQCYSRHHGEKTGYRVIFTIKDHLDRLVAQAITNPTIITDDHKANQTNKAGSDVAHQGFPEVPGYSGGDFPQTASGSQGLPPFTRNSFSTPNLQSLQHSHPFQAHTRDRNSGQFSNTSQTSLGQPASRPSSRPASPSALSGSQNKRRKGSGSGSYRVRPELTMTRINPSRSANRPAPLAGPPTGPSFEAGTSVHPPFSPNYAPPVHGFSSPQPPAQTSSTSPAPHAFQPSFYQTSQRTNNLPQSQGHYSAPTSAWQSQHTSPDSSPNSPSHPHSQAAQPQFGIANQMNNIARPNAYPAVRRVIPNQGPITGGIEISCLVQNYRPGLQIHFGQQPALISQVWGGHTVVCILPAAARPGDVEVTVQNITTHGIATPPSSPVTFTYVDQNHDEMMRYVVQMMNQQFGGQPGLPPQTNGNIRPPQTNGNLPPSFGPQHMGGNHPGPGHSQHQNQSRTALHHSVGVDDLEKFALRCLELVDEDENPNTVNLNTRGVNGQSILHASVSSGYYRLLAGLLARGAHADLRDNNGLTPMHLASMYGHVQMIRKLRSAGADPTIRSLNGTRPADIAASSQVQKTVEDLGYHSRSKSVDATPVKQLSRANSTRSITSHHASDWHTSPSANIERFAIGGDLDMVEKDACGPQPQVRNENWPRSRRASAARTLDCVGTNAEDRLNDDAAAFAASPAMSAWRDQISAQIMQLQQSVHRALPPIPNLPDYQAYPVMRRISNLVPQCGIGNRSDSVQNVATKVKAPDYHWWELITGPATSPPAYDEIFPDQKQQGLDQRKPSALIAAALDFAPDKTCQTLFDPAEGSTAIGTVNIGPNGLTKQQQQQIRTAHAMKVKKLRSDRKLFFIWIPLLIIIITMMIKDRAPQVWGIAGLARAFLGGQAQQQIV